MRTLARYCLPLMLPAAILSCSDPGQPRAGTWSRLVGFVDSGGIAIGPLAVPDTVSAGVSFTVTVSTFGSTGCIRPDQSQVQQGTTSADITPYDSVWSGTPPCLPGWQAYARPVELRFDTPGSGLIRAHGRGFDRDLTLERSVTIKP